MILVSERKLFAINAAMFCIVFLAVRIYIGSVYDLSPICEDGWVSQSIGSQGACSSHGGVDYSRGFFALVFSAVSGLIALYLVSQLNLFKIEYAANVEALVVSSELKTTVNTSAIVSRSTTTKPPTENNLSIDSQMIPNITGSEHRDTPTQLELFGGRNSWTPKQTPSPKRWKRPTKER